MSTEGCKLSNSVALQHWQMVVATNATGFDHFSRFPEARVPIAAEAPPNLERNLDFVQDDTTGPFRARVAKDSSREASASSWATSAGATRSVR